MKDNQGLMRRMYGDQRHGHVLKSELNDLDDFEEEWEKKERAQGGYGHWRPTPVRYASFNVVCYNLMVAELDLLDTNATLTI